MTLGHGAVRDGMTLGHGTVTDGMTLGHGTVRDGTVRDGMTLGHGTVEVCHTALFRVQHAVQNGAHGVDGCPVALIGRRVVECGHVVFCMTRFHPISFEVIERLLHDLQGKMQWHTKEVRKIN